MINNSRYWLRTQGPPQKPQANKPRRRTGRAWRSVLVLATVLGMLIAGMSGAGATVGTDQADYSPGSVVTVSGDNSNGVGYVEGNSVDVTVLGPNGWTSGCAATVAADGTWSCQVTLDSDPEIAVGDYTYTATSTAADGTAISETGTFTDLISTRFLNPAVAPASGLPGRSLTFTGTLQQYIGLPGFGSWLGLGNSDVKLRTYPGTGCTGTPTVVKSVTTPASSGAFSIPWTAPTTAGTYYYDLRFAGAEGGTWNPTSSPCLNVTVIKLVPLFTFDLTTLPAKTFGDVPFSVAGYAAKTPADTGAITFATHSGSVGCTVSTAGLVTITGAATGADYCKIDASLAADLLYVAAGPITQSFQIAKGTPSFTFDLAALPAKTFGDGTFSVAGYATKPADDTGAIAFATASDSTGCTVTSAGLVTITGAATGAAYCKINASLAEDSNYLAAGPVSGQFNIAKAMPLLTFDLATLPAKTFGDPDFSVAGYASKPSDDTGAITFATAPDSVGCTVTEAGLVTITGAAVGTAYCKIRAALAGDSNYLIPNRVQAQFNIAKLGTSVLYTGAQSVIMGNSFSASATLAPSACGASQPITFAVETNLTGSLTPITVPGTATTAYVLGTATTRSDGKATVSIPTTGLPEYVGSLYAIYAGNGNCVASYDEASLMVASPGDSAQGGGWEASGPSNGRLNFGFTVNLVSGTGGTTGVPAKYKGQFVMVNNGAWRLKGTLNTYVQTKTTLGITGSSDGVGTLYKWVLLNPTTNLYGWQKTSDTAKFSIAFADNNAGGGKKTLNPDTFGIQIQYSASAIPNNKAAPSVLKGGDISIKTTK